MNDMNHRLNRLALESIRRPLVAGGVAILLLSITFLAGLGAGFGLAHWSGPTTALGYADTAPSVAAETTVGHVQDAQSALRENFDLFWEAMDLVYRDFYGDLPEADEITYAAIRGVLDILDDPNTSFLTPAEADFFRTSMEGSFEGIGARVAWDEEADTVVITEPFENQPAWLAGLRRNDLILAIDGEELVGTDLTEAVQKIRGPKGSTIVLTVLRTEEGTFDVSVTRDRIEIPTIRTDSLGPAGEIAYVRLNSFNENAGQLVREAVHEARKRSPQGMILDLRGNTGGLLREAVKVSSVFLDDQTILIERFSDGNVETYRTSGRSELGDLPLVVLVNQGTASASEIVAGALQDADRAPLIGATTFGKGSVQLPHTLSNGAILRVTIAQWFTPLDRTIDGVGLQPDVIVPVSEDEIERGDDPQLDAAVNYLMDETETTSN